MAGTPVVSWYNRDNSAQVTSWPIGTVDAGTTSPDFGVLVWNNRAGTADVSDMVNCTVTTKDNLGGNTGALVTGKWVEAKVDSDTTDTAFTGIGGTVTKNVKAGGAAVGAGVIKGTLNDGTKANGIPNFAEITLRAKVPPDATAGNIDFLTRISYQFT